MAYISFEEVKEILKKSIDETTSVNEALEKTVQFIYSKGYEDGSVGCKHLNTAICNRCQRKATDFYSAGEDKT